MTRAFVIAFLVFAAAPASAESLKPWAGGKTPPLELADPEGAVHRLADYRGKVVLVNFWATWCAPCRAEMPSLERLRASLEGRPFAVLAVNVGENPRAAREFADKLPVRFTILMDRDVRATKAWGAKLLPVSFLVGPDGSIRYSYLGDLDWSSAQVREKVESLLPKQDQRAQLRP